MPMRVLHDPGTVLATMRLVILCGLALACTPGTEPSSNPREPRTDAGLTSRVSGQVLTAGIMGSSDTRRHGEAGDSAGGGRLQVGALTGSAIGPSQPLAGVVVELGIVHFDRASDSAVDGTTRTLLVPIAVPDVWAGPAPRILDPGPASPPGRFEAIARARTNGRGEFSFSRAPRGKMLMLRARPPAPYLETYSRTPFWLGSGSAKVVDVVVRAGSH